MEMTVLTSSSQCECAVSLGEVLTQIGKVLLHQLPFGVVLKASV